MGHGRKWEPEKHSKEENTSENVEEG
jgi:hypothetical protein